MLKYRPIIVIHLVLQFIRWKLSAFIRHSNLCASDAKVLLADEPTGNLDEVTARDVIDILKRIAHKDGKCVIVVTRSKELANETDEIIHIKN